MPTLVAETSTGPVPLGPALSIFDAVHVGIDEFGHPVRVPMIERNMLIGGEPGAGKSALLNAVARRVVKLAGLDPDEWTPRELRHSFVSLLSSNGVTTQDIADLCGHSATTVTERVYPHELRPVLLRGAVAMDRIFDDGRQGVDTQLDAQFPDGPQYNEDAR